MMTNKISPAYCGFDCAQCPVRTATLEKGADDKNQRCTGCMEPGDKLAFCDDCILRGNKALIWLMEHGIEYSCYSHPEGKTIEEAKQWWRNDGSLHCKNIFLRNHKGNQHYLVCFDCDHDLDIHDLEQRLKAELMAAGLNSPGKLSFASPERMMRYLGLLPGSVSPFGLINDTEHHVILFLDENLQKADTLSFHPNDCRGTVVITRDEFTHYLSLIGNTLRYMKLYD